MPHCSSEDYLDVFLQHTSLALAIVRSIEARLFSTVELVPPVLDIGCGDGLFAQLTFGKILDAGIDASAAEVRRAIRRGAYVKAITGSADSIPFPDCHFNTVIANCVLEHIAEPVTIFREVCRVLTHGGHWYFTAHSQNYESFLYFTKVFRSMGLESAARIYGRLMRTIFRHFSCLSPDIWSAMLREAGFVDILCTPYLANRTLETFDRYLLLSVPSFFQKKLFGRWVILPRKWLVRRWGKRFRPLYEESPAEGGAIFISARKPEESASEHPPRKSLP